MLRQAQQEGNSNGGTPAAFLSQLPRRHSGRLNVIWDNAPAHRGAAMREYLRTPGLGLGLVPPVFTRAGSAGVQPGLQCRRGHLGLDGRGGHRQPVPGKQRGGAGAGRQIPGQAVQPERRGETALPDRPAIKGRSTPAEFPVRFLASGKCTSHLGFGLEGLFRSTWYVFQMICGYPDSFLSSCLRKTTEVLELLFSAPYSSVPLET